MPVSAKIAAGESKQKDAEIAAAEKSDQTSSERAKAEKKKTAGKKDAAVQKKEESAEDGATAKEAKSPDERAAKPRKKSATGAAAVRALLSEKSPEAGAFLVNLMQDEEQKTELRIKAAESILDRACGKAGSAAVGTASGGEMIVRFEGALEEWSR